MKNVFLVLGIVQIQVNLSWRMLSCTEKSYKSHIFVHPALSTDWPPVVNNNHYSPIKYKIAIYFRLVMQSCSKGL